MLWADCAQKHGHVWMTEVLGQKLYALGGAEGLKAFYDEKNVIRFPGMSDNLIEAAWQLEVTVLLPSLCGVCCISESPPGRDL